MKTPLCLGFVVLALFVTVSPSNARAFAIRGIKGLFWQGAEHYREAIPWLADHNMNFLALCYTSFPASASDWRADYTPAEKEDIRALAAQAKKLRVNLCLSFNPGIWSNPALVYSSEEDYQSTLSKVKSIHELGVDWFALCLDDMTRDLRPEDIRRFGTLGPAQAYFVSRLWNDMKRLKPKPKLIFTPIVFFTNDALQNMGYMKAIGAIDREVMIAWTGPDVGSVSITAEDARAFGKMIRRKPFVWDNYPCNHACGWRPLVGPLKNRSKDLGDAVSGFMVNPLKQWYASDLPLATIADYLNDPVNYDPAAAMERAIKSHPADQQRGLRLLVDLYGHSFFGDPGYPPQPRPTSPDDALKKLPSYRALRKELSERPELKGLWEDVRPAVEEDIALLQRRGRNREKESPLKAFGEDFDGGAAPLFGYRQFERSANYVYAQPTTMDRMSVDFWIDAIPESGAVLKMTARDGDAAHKTRIQILINNGIVFEGQNEFSGAAFETRSFDLPAASLKPGRNPLVIRNMEESGLLGVPPFFMVAEAEILL